VADPTPPPTPDRTWLLEQALVHLRIARSHLRSLPCTKSSHDADVQMLAGVIAIGVVLGKSPEEAARGGDDVGDRIREAKPDV
jgi:hypothetical protein